MNTDSDMLDRHLQLVYGEIAEAARKRDLPTISQLSSRAAQLEELKAQYASLQKRIAGLDAEQLEAVAPTSLQSSTAGLRDLVIEVTEGMRRQNLLTLTPHVKRGRIKPGEQLTIDAEPSGHRFQTELL